MNPKALGGAAVVAALALDQLTKAYVVHGFEAGTLEARPLMPSLDLALRFNHGVSFSLMRQDGALGALLLVGFSCAVAAALAVWLWRARTLPTGAALGLIIGGALGNALDRLRFGAVVDFLDLHALERHFFVFNVADAAISAGVALLIVEGMFGEKAR